jgi:hypothetical protein
MCYNETEEPIKHLIFGLTACQLKQQIFLDELSSLE